MSEGSLLPSEQRFDSRPWLPRTPRSSPNYLPKSMFLSVLQETSASANRGKGKARRILVSISGHVIWASYGIFPSLSFPTCKKNLISTLQLLESCKFIDTNASRNSKQPPISSVTVSVPILHTRLPTYDFPFYSPRCPLPPDHGKLTLVTHDLLSPCQLPLLSWSSWRVQLMKFCAVPRSPTMVLLPIRHHFSSFGFPNHGILAIGQSFGKWQMPLLIFLVSFYLCPVHDTKVW